jgi:hypothetical protein
VVEAISLVEKRKSLRRVKNKEAIWLNVEEEKEKESKLSMLIPWQKKEKKDTKRFQGRRQPRSGGIWFMPGDVKLKEFLIDDKTTDKLSYSIKNTTWNKISNEALLLKRLPALNVRLGDGTEVTIVDTNDFRSWFKE